MRQEEIPQALGFRLGLQPLHDFFHARRMLPAIAILADLGVVLLLQRDDLVAHHVANLIHKRLHAVAQSKIHHGHAGLLPASCALIMTGW